MKRVRLDTVAEINPRKPGDLDPNQFCAFVPMERIDDWSGRIVAPLERQVKEVEKGYTYFADRDVLFAKITPCMENGKCAVASRLRNAVGFGSTEFHVIRAREEVSPEWVYYFMRQEAVRQEAKRHMTGSAGQQRVPADFVAQIEIPLPPLPEQQRIAGILSRADRLRRLRRYALEMSEGYLQAVFLEMFGDPITNAMRWSRAKIADLGRVQTGNTPSRDVPAFFGEHIEWIKSDNILDDEMFVSQSREMLSEDGLKNGRSVEAGAVLMTCIAGSLSSVGDVALTNRRVAFNQQINAITPYRDVSPLFLHTLLKAAQPLVQYNASAGMKHIITKSKLEELVLIKPPFPQQEGFAAIARQHEQLRSQQREALRQAEHLFQTLLHGAFRGAV